MSKRDFDPRCHKAIARKQKHGGYEEEETDPPPRRNPNSPTNDQAHNSGDPHLYWWRSGHGWVLVLDVHSTGGNNLTVAQVQTYLPRLPELAGGNNKKEVYIVHGHNKGTAVRDLLRRHYGGCAEILRDNPGITMVKLRWKAPVSKAARLTHKMQLK